MKINNLGKNYGDITILKDINFELKCGEIVGLVGRNGVGKSTLMKILAQNSKPTLGTVTSTGNVGYLIEEPKLFLSKTGLENLKYLSTLYGIDFNQEKFGSFVQTLDLTQSINKKVKTYSLGTKQKLALLSTLVTEPEFLILDEPTNGLDVETSQKVLGLLQHLASSENVGILISSHQLEDIEEICTRVLFLENGLLTSRTLGKNSNISLIDIVFQSLNDLEIFTSRQSFGEVIHQDGLKITLSGVIKSGDLFKFFNEHSIKVVDFETKKETLKDIYLNRSK